MNIRKEEILRIALELYNKLGLENVSIRDIAKELKISPGNLTYHFPTQNDINFALAQECVKKIDEALAFESENSQKSTLLRFYRQCEIVFQQQLDYEFAFNKRYAEILISFEKLQKLAQEILPSRFDHWLQLHEQMVKEKTALPSLKKAGHSIYHVINILSLYWHQEVNIYYPEFSKEEKIKYGLTIVFQTYKPYLTAKGLAEIEPLLFKLGRYAMA